MFSFVDPNQTTLSVTHAGVTYTKKYFKPAVSITGVTDEAHADYNPATLYAEGAYCIVPELKTIYRAKGASQGSVSDNFPPAYPNLWTDFGPINSYRMFASDENIGSTTTGTDAVIELDFKRSNTFAMVGTEFISVLVEQIDNGTATTIHTETIDGKDIGCLSFSQYFYGRKKPRKRVIRTGLKWLPNSTLRLTFSGAVSIGALVYGKREDLAITLMGTGLNPEANSKITNSPITGFRTVLRYGVLRVIDARVAFDIDDYSYTAERAIEIMDKNMLWIPTTQDKFLSMITIGYIERFPMKVDNMKKVITETTIVGVY